MKCLIEGCSRLALPRNIRCQPCAAREAVSEAERRAQGIYKCTTYWCYENTAQPGQACEFCLGKPWPDELAGAHSDFDEFDEQHDRGVYRDPFTRELVNL